MYTSNAKLSKFKKHKMRMSSTFGKAYKHLISSKRYFKSSQRNTITPNQITA